MQKYDFNRDWLFWKQGDRNSKIVTLPHDAMIHEPRDAESEGGSAHGYFPGGKYIYEKRFTAPAEWKGKKVDVLFEGVYRNSKVWLNGELIHEHRYGYTPFVAELGQNLHIGEENTLQVTVDNSQLPNSRWYSGSGIYRAVSLLVGDEAHIHWQGIKIKTLSYSPAVVQVKTNATNGSIFVEILDGTSIVAQGQGSDVTLTVPNAKLWCEDTPYLYTCRVTLKKDGIDADCVEQKFGIRTLEWSEKKGLLVNGVETLLRGGCVHHDNGILGACAYPESEERRVRIIKEAGYNAIRSAHNPCSVAMVEACDKFGVYLIDETFDVWYSHKSKYDYASDFESCWAADTRAMVERDYNHPSVIAYSICNEVSEPCEQQGIKAAQDMIALIHSLDDTRPVTGGVNLMIIDKASKGNGIYQDAEKNDISQRRASNNEGKNVSLIFNTIASFMGTSMNKAANSDHADKITTPVLDALDIAGYNYASGRYEMDGQKHPKRIIYGSETFPQDIYKNWKMIEKYPYLIGDFMWTAWDYLGEAGIGAWSYTGGLPFARPYPWILGGAGAIDILGNPDIASRYAAVVWNRIDHPVIGVRPLNHPGVRVTKSVWRGSNAVESWAWRNCEGNRGIVEVYAQGAFAQLLINGKPIGKKRLRQCKALFRIKYQPGIIEAVIFDSNDVQIGRHTLKSAGEQLYITPHPEKVVAKPGEIVYIPIAIEDVTGIVESNGDVLLCASVSGGELLGFGSANPCTKETYDSGRFTTYRGRALAVVRMGEGNLELNIKTDSNLVHKKAISVQIACSK